MPKDPKTGELLLKAVKKEQTERQAARTALALVRLESSSIDLSLSQDIPEPVPAPEKEVLWVRHVFESEICCVRKRRKGSYHHTQGA